MIDEAQQHTDHPEKNTSAKRDDVPPLFRVRSCRTARGERLPLVIDQCGIPVALPNQYMLRIRRQQLQFNSLAAEMNTIAHVYDWAARRGVNLDNRLKTGKALTPSEIHSLFQNLHYVRALARRSTKVVIDIENIRMVGPDEHRTRVQRARDFLAWGLQDILFQLDPSDIAYYAIKERCEHIYSIASTVVGSASRPQRRGLPPHLLERLIKVIHPLHPGNPFSKPVRFRNYLIIKVLVDCGFRRGEFLKIYVIDVLLNGRDPSLSIERRPDDPNDTRGVEPSVKTLGRTLALNRELAKLLYEFIQYHRPRFPGALQSPFLFLSRGGDPLSLRAANAMFQQIRKRYPEFEGHLHPHALRHTFNDRLSYSRERLNMTDDEFKQARNYLNGWAPTSEQSETYTQRSTMDRANRLILEHQRRLFER